MGPANSSQEVAGSWTMVCRAGRRYPEAFSRGKSSDKPSSGDDHKSDRPAWGRGCQAPERGRPGQSKMATIVKTSSTPGTSPWASSRRSTWPRSFTSSTRAQRLEVFVSLGEHVDALGDARSPLRTRVEWQKPVGLHRREHAVDVVDMSTVRLSSFGVNAFIRRSIVSPPAGRHSWFGFAVNCVTLTFVSGSAALFWDGSPHQRRRCPPPRRRARRPCW
jgi:hypothetical protein